MNATLSTTFEPWFTTHFTGPRESRELRPLDRVADLATFHGMAGGTTATSPRPRRR